MYNPIALLVYADSTLPKGYSEYEPETLREALNLDTLDIEKLQVMLIAFHTTHIFDEWHVFEKAVAVINNRHADFEHIQDLTTSELVYALKCIRRIDNSTTFTDEVLTKMALIVHEDGIAIDYVPDILNNEISVSGLRFKFFLSKFNNSDSILDSSSIAVQQEMIKAINLYVDTNYNTMISDFNRLKNVSR